MSKRGPLKRLTRAVRLSIYHRLHGAGFRYHGIPVTIPDEIPFGIKKQVMRNRYEEPERRLVERFLDPKLPVLEVGGSLGILSAFVASRLGPDTPYLIVEANPRVLDACRANARSGRGAKGSVDVLHGALAYGGDMVDFPVDDNVHINRVGAKVDKMVSVRAHSLRDLLGRMRRLEGPFTLIMDIEGAEFDVFANEGDVFATCALAIVETHPHLFAARGKTLEDFLDLVRAAGLTVLERDDNSFAFARA